MMRTPISSILDKKGSYVCHLPSFATVAECINKMNHDKVGAIAIINEDQLVGIFTERDILRKVYPQHIDTNTTPVSNVMTAEVIYAKPDTTIEEVMATFTERRFRHLPIMEGNKLMGIVSIGDITKWIISSQQNEIELLADYIKGVYR